jgi:quinol monooxygenase YgiN
LTVSILVEGQLKDGERDGFTEICREAFKVTRDFDGGEHIDLVYNTEDSNNWVFNEIWESKEHYDKYLKFRSEDGTLEAIAGLCENAPSIKIFDIIYT